MPLKARKVVSLVRVSTTAQGDDDRGGIPRQREVIEKIIAARGLNRIRSYEIANVSGTSVRHSPEVQEILAMVAAREIDGVVVSDLDRFMRADRLDSYVLLQDFQDAGAVIYAADFDTDFSTADGTLFGTMKFAFSGFELSIIKARMQGGKEAKRRVGKCPSSAITLPTGVRYDRKSETFYYDEAAIAPVKEAFRLVDEEGVTNQAELSRLTGIQVRTVSNILRNELYMGRRVYRHKRGREKYGSRNGAQSDRKKVQRLPDEIIDCEVIKVPAVSPERFARVQTVLAETRGRWTKRQASKVLNLGVGLARCGFCGERLYCSSGKKSSRPSASGYYVCKKNYYLYKKDSGGCQMRSVRKGDLDETLRRFTAEHVATPQVVTRIIDHALRSFSARTTISLSEAQVQAQLKDIGARERRNAKAHEAGTLSLELFGELMAELKREKIAIEVARQQSQQIAEIDTAELTHLIVRGANAFRRTTDPTHQKMVAHQLFSEVRFRDDMIVSFKLHAQFATAGEIEVRANAAESGMHSGRDSSRRRA